MNFTSIEYNTDILQKSILTKTLDTSEYIDLTKKYISQIFLCSPILFQKHPDVLISSKSPEIAKIDNYNEKIVLLPLENGIIKTTEKQIFCSVGNFKILDIKHWVNVKSISSVCFVFSVVCFSSFKFPLYKSINSSISLFDKFYIYAKNN